MSIRIYRVERSYMENSELQKASVKLFGEENLPVSDNLKSIHRFLTHTGMVQPADTIQIYLEGEDGEPDLWLESAVLLDPRYNEWYQTEVFAL